MLASTASENPVNTKYESQKSLSSLNVQQTGTGNPYWALVHQTTQNGTMTKSGLLKSGNLMKSSKQERCARGWATSRFVHPAHRQICH